jgi:hypothetical protein
MLQITIIKLDKGYLVDLISIDTKSFSIPAGHICYSFSTTEDLATYFEDEIKAIINQEFETDPK